MKRSLSPACLACCAALGISAAGCQTTQTAAPVEERLSAQLDPRAERLHDVSGQLLLFHYTHRRLPRTLEELAAMGDGQSPSLVCPDTGRPYVYDPTGLQIPGQSGRLLLYEPTASYPGMRWGILVADAETAKALIVRVVLLPENAILSAAGEAQP